MIKLRLIQNNCKLKEEDKMKIRELDKVKEMLQEIAIMFEKADEINLEVQTNDILKHVEDKINNIN